MNTTVTALTSIFTMTFLNFSGENLLKLFRRISIQNLPIYNVSNRCTLSLKIMIELCHISLRLIYFITHSPVPTTGRPDISDSGLNIVRSLFYIIYIPPAYCTGLRYCTNKSAKKDPFFYHKDLYLHFSSFII